MSRRRVLRLTLWAALALVGAAVALLAAALMAAPTVNDLGGQVDRFAAAP